MIKYNDFLNEDAEDKPIKEKVLAKLQFSQTLRDILVKIKTDAIAKKLIQSEGDLEADVSWLDIVEDPTIKDGSKYVSFFPATQAKKLGVDTSKPTDKNNPIWKDGSGRQRTRFGTVISKLFDKEFSAHDVDVFYNRFRPEVDGKKPGSDRFQLVSGEDIRMWYHEKMYNGQMGSCMRYEACQPYFDIYCKNPDRCRLLIYLDDTGKKALGRALVWNNLVKPCVEDAVNDDEKMIYTLMDRVYVVQGNDQVAAKFQKYAIDNGWIYKNGDQFLMDGVSKTRSVTTRVIPMDYGRYPYADTMVYFTPGTGRLSSSAGNLAKRVDENGKEKIFKRKKLRSQHGGVEEMD